ncbi:protein neprosin-like [Tasmannia lanceolata]|uniref:protein neprosin-like n=1 Tax=Tasmannia lanceolata TaxID=3420 RepID=UPI0040641607
MAFIEKAHSYSMALNAMTLFLLLPLSLVVNNRVEGGRTILSREEDLELDRQLKLLKKPAIKTIKEHGQIFDCVHIKKQPAFDHPALKNHKIQMAPSSLPNGFMDKNNSSSILCLESVLKHGGCPRGHVPIRRIKKEDLISAKSRLNFQREHLPNLSVKVVNPYFYSAGQGTPNGTYYGTQTDLNVWSPRVWGSSQYSSSRIWVTDGEDLGNNIQVGWLVKKEKYNDDLPHLFTFWKKGNYLDGCEDHNCPGFVQVNSGIPLGAAIHPSSIYNGRQNYIRLSVYKDPLAKNWWLLWGVHSTPVGYWPKDLFTSSFQDYANKIAWGGIVYTDGMDSSPEMGSGHFSYEGFKQSCYVGRIIVVNEGSSGNVDPNSLLTYKCQSQCYNIKPYANVGYGGYAFTFGGPGGNCSNQLN